MHVFFPAVALLRGTGDDIAYGVGAIAALLFFAFRWKLATRQKGKDGAVVATVTDKNVPVDQSRKPVSLRFIIVTQTITFVGAVLVFANLGRLHERPPSLYVGIAILMVGGVLKIISDLRFVKDRTASRDRS